jgi:hypothetical protein
MTIWLMKDVDLAYEVNLNEWSGKGRGIIVPKTGG